MKINKDYLGIFVLCAMMFVTIFLVLRSDTQRANAGTFIATNIGAVATTSSTTIVSVSQRILATTSSPLDPTNSYQRVYASICASHQNSIWIRLDGDKPTNIDLKGAILVATGTCYFINSDNQYQGSITASSTNQTPVKVTTTEYVN